MLLYIVAYQRLEMMLIFSLATYSSDRFSRFPSNLKLVLLPELEAASLAVFKKRLCVWQPLANFTSAHELVPPFPVFSSNDVSGKVWPKSLLLNKQGFSPKCR